MEPHFLGFGVDADVGSSQGDSSSLFEVETTLGVAFGRFLVAELLALPIIHVTTGLYREDPNDTVGMGSGTATQYHSKDYADEGSH